MTNQCSQVQMGEKVVIVCDESADSSAGWASSVQAGQMQTQAPVQATVNDEACVEYHARQVMSPPPKGAFDRFAGSAKSYVAGWGCNKSGQTDIQRLKETAMSNDEAGALAARALYEIAGSKPELAQECIAGLGSAASTNILAAQSLRELARFHPELKKDIENALKSASEVVKFQMKELPIIGNGNPALKPQIERSLQKKAQIAEYVGSALNEL